MRISIPSIPSNGTYTPVLLPTTQIIQRLIEFLGASTGAAVLTGAGVSVDSGIRAYRGDHGRYINPNYKLVVRFMEDYVELTGCRVDRYWCASQTFVV